MTVKPTNAYTWATDVGAIVSVLNVTRQGTGFKLDTEGLPEKPPMGDLNGLLENYGEWRVFFEELTDRFGLNALQPNPRTPADLFVTIEAGDYTLGVANVNIATQQTFDFTSILPVTDPRIDLLHVDSAGTVQRVAGTEAPSPTAPSHAGLMPVMEVTLSPAMTEITSSEILDVRPRGSRGGVVDILGAIMSGNLTIAPPSGQAELLLDAVATQAAVAKFLSAGVDSASVGYNDSSAWAFLNNVISGNNIRILDAGGPRSLAFFDGTAQRTIAHRGNMIVSSATANALGAGDDVQLNLPTALAQADYIPLGLWTVQSVVSSEIQVTLQAQGGNWNNWNITNHSGSSVDVTVGQYFFEHT